MFQEPVSLAVCYESDGNNKTIEQNSITFAIFMGVVVRKKCIYLLKPWCKGERENGVDLSSYQATRN